MKSLRFLFFPCLVVAAVLCAAGGARAQEAVENTRPDFVRSLERRQPLTVGATTDSFPYGYSDGTGNPKGFSVDLLDAVARVMNLRIRRVPATGSVLHDRFKQGEFDLLQAYSQAPDREGFADFSVPFLTLQGAIFVRKSGGPIHALSDFEGRDFAIIGVGSMGETFLRAQNIHPRLVQVSSSEEGLRLVESGACAGVFVSRLTALSVIERVGLRNVAMFGLPLADYDIRHCLAVHKGDAQLLARLNEGLAILHRTGEFDQIYRRWFGRFDAPVFSREEVVNYVAAALALALLAAVWGLLRQRALRRRITAQAERLAEDEGLLQALYNNIPMAMCVLEAAPDGKRVLAINRQAEVHFGVPAKLAAGRMLADLNLDREWAEQFADVLQRWPAVGSLVR